MKFTDDEKQIIRNALKRHLKDVLEVKQFADQELEIYKAEVQFERAVKEILKKLD